MTEHLQEKINVLRNQIRQGDLEIFNHTLIVNDAAEACGDEKGDNTFQAQANNARSVIRIWEHKNKSRRALLDKLLEEQKTQQKAEKPAE